jgi:hypothetical protein
MNNKNECINSKDGVLKATLGVVRGKKRVNGVRILKSECSKLSGDNSM